MMSRCMHPSPLPICLSRVCVFACVAPAPPPPPSRFPACDVSSGQTFATADDTGSVCVVDLSSGALRKVLRKHTLFATTVAFKPGSGPRMELASGGFDCHLLLW
jgi:hypothetical protein